MNILILKIFLAPVTITLCTLLARRYGHAIGGAIIGLPLASGPVALILALQNGKEFVAEFSNGIQYGLALVAVYDIVYAHTSKKFHWAICSLFGWLIYCLIFFFLKPASISIFHTYAFVTITILFILYFFPKAKPELIKQISHVWDIPIRIGVALSMVLLITFLANHLGAQKSGTVSSFPVYSTVFAASTHSFYGANAAQNLLRGTLIGKFSFALFFLVIGTTIVQYGIVLSFSIAIVAAIILQFLLHKYLNNALTS